MFLVCSRETRLTEWVTKRKLGRRPFLVEVVMTFSRRSMGSCLALLTLTIVSSPPGAAAMPPHWSKECVKIWRQWQKKPGHKAFAMSPVRPGMYFYCGATYSASSKDLAEKDAIKACQNQKGGRNAACYITASE
jgi:hypothetical protein